MSKHDDEKEQKRWRSRLSRGKRYQAIYSKNWKVNEALVYGRDAANRDAQTTVSWAYGLVKSLETSIYVQDPEGIAEAYDEAKTEAARRWTNIVNYDLPQMNLKAIGNIGLMDNWIYGYFSAIETVESEKAIRYPDDDTEKKPKRKKDVDDVHPDAVITGQNYMSRRINPWDILFDQSGTLYDLSDHRYTFTAFYPSVSQLEEDPLFGKNLPDNMEAFPECSPFTRRQLPTDVKDTRHEGEKDPDFKTICVWEIHDKLNGEILYMTDHRELIIGRQDLPFKLNIGGRRMFPITLMVFNPSPIGFYPTPEIDLVAPQLTMLNELDAIIYKDARTKWRKFAAFSSLVSPEECAKITDPNPENSVVLVDTTNLNELAGTGVHQYPDLKDLITHLQDPAPKQDLFAVREMIIEEITQIIGYGPPSRGGLPKTRSAREAVAVKEKLEARLAKRADAVTDFYRDFVRKHIQIVSQTLEVERYARVYESDADAYKYLKYTKDDIRGQFDYQIYAGSSMPKNTESKRASERELATLMMPFAQQLGTGEAVVERLAEAYQWKNWRNIFKNHKQALKQLALMWFSIKEQGKQVPPEQILNLQGQVVMSGLSMAELAEVKAMASGETPGGPPGQASPAKPRGDQAPNKTESGVM